ncbi:hypothetical protein [Zooshikella harenae]|uniref:Uncharacterized protein n=1 Tax=Zooshikella harenae TaxID=2827238 RepID=A0ABS5ZM49_9GAMM|nr:hypothetical protein [Zooshikella harenae]MBU2714387.1 hypothetical protein [Zooshikella harenae]
MKNNFNFIAIIRFFLIIIISLLGSVYGQPLIHKTPEALNVIVTMFSILSGFLVAIITLIGDEKVLPSGGYRAVILGQGNTRKRLRKQQFLFYIYLRLCLKSMSKDWIV